MLDNRLDYIGKFVDGTTEKMAQYRALFMQLDDELRKLGMDTQIGHRNLAIARTAIESACMNTIKVICLQGEAKE